MKPKWLEKWFPPFDPEQDALTYWRERILFGLLVGGLALSPIAIIPAVVLIIKRGLWLLAAVDTVALAVLVYLLFSPRLGFFARALGLIATLYAISIGVLTNAGIISGGPFWLFFVPILTSLLLGWRAAGLAVLLNAVTLAVVVSLVSRQVIGLDETIKVHQGYLEALSEAFRQGTPVFTELHTGEEKPVPHISVVAPIFSENGPAAAPRGAVVLICDASRFLYPLIQSWPTPSRTAETVLVQRQGDGVLFLNDLRHRPDTALKLRIPLTETDVPAVMAVRGREGVVEGTDYRGMPVVSVILPVPDSPWFMVAKEDAAEVYGEWHSRALLIMGMLRMLRRLIGEDIDLQWLPAGGLWPVKIDPSQVDQLLANLCVNARDAIDGVGKITIETENVHFDPQYCRDHLGFTAGDYVLLAVSDDGSGMDAETRSHLFEPFFTTKDAGQGTGLGLATVYGIVKQNNGFINVYSEPGAGTTFRIYLPRHSAQAAAEDPGAAADIPRGNGETVLIVEDEAAILKLGQTLLENLGYHVLAAASTAEAITLAEAHGAKIHLLITDVVMPEMNGRDLARRLQKLYPDLRVLFMSGYTADVIAHRGILDKGMQFIQKPFSREELAVKVAEGLK
jgi:CheY-like chemotaxis protein